MDASKMICNILTMDTNTFFFVSSYDNAQTLRDDIMIRNIKPSVYEDIPQEILNKGKEFDEAITLMSKGQEKLLLFGSIQDGESIPQDGSPNPSI